MRDRIILFTLVPLIQFIHLFTPRQVSDYTHGLQNIFYNLMYTFRCCIVYDRVSLYRVENEFCDLKIYFSFYIHLAYLLNLESAEWHTMWLVNICLETMVIKSTTYCVLRANSRHPRTFIITYQTKNKLWWKSLITNTSSLCQRIYRNVSRKHRLELLALLFRIQEISRSIRSEGWLSWTGYLQSLQQILVFCL